MVTDVEPVAPVVLEHGRYKLSLAPDGSGFLARAVGLCETCQGCGCGTGADLIGPLPSEFMKILQGEPLTFAERAAMGMKLLPMMKAMMGNGNGDGSGSDAA